LTLPFAIQQAKAITVASDISYPPMESFQPNTQTPQGVDVDIANAMGKKLGVQFVFQNAKFEGLVSGLVARSYDAVMSGMKDTGTRRDAGVDFVDYFQSGIVMVVQKNNPKKIVSPGSLCGKTVGVQQGTPQEDLLRSQAAECATTTTGSTTTTVKGAKPTVKGAVASSTTTTTTRLRSSKGTTTTVKGGLAQGKLTVQTFPDDATALAQLKAGKLTALLTDLPTAATLIVQQPTAIQLAGDQIQPVPFGIAVSKDDSQLRDAIAGALHAIIADGTYGQILAKYQVSVGAVADATINTGA
jgi:polar amino acid transport system substrate-binding protein